jgi:hypothetical protein
MSDIHIYIYTHTHTHIYMCVCVGGGAYILPRNVCEWFTLKVLPLWPIWRFGYTFGHWLSEVISVTSRGTKYFLYKLIYTSTYTTERAAYLQLIYILQYLRRTCFSQCLIIFVWKTLCNIFSNQFHAPILFALRYHSSGNPTDRKLKGWCPVMMGSTPQGRNLSRISTFPHKTHVRLPVISVYTKVLSVQLCNYDCVVR